MSRPWPEAEERIIQALVDSGDYGMTGDELEHKLGILHQSIGAPLLALRKSGRVVDSGRKRLTRNGRPAIVWQVTK